MAEKTDTQVIIGGKVLTLTGFESEEYLQKVASYLNSKLSECGEIEGFNRQPIDMQNLMIQLNLADDYFKAKDQIRLLDEEIKEKEKELYDLKHELVTSQIKLENTEKNLKNVQDNLDADAKKLIELETQLKNNNNSSSGYQSNNKKR
ncbi:cell division protein ZapA [Butyrivibrio sp. NC3005]|uniref:cell division protein ZapA n=1 Tax=Butyrivibrio sp. NC3005 TaxID=1280685 RepID=UPI00040DC99A|nr:cell division protein ZapA [Butyrivibrio sp. NC3005]